MAKRSVQPDPMTALPTIPAEVDYFWTAPPGVMPRLSLLPGPRRPQCCQNCERTTWAGDVIRFWVECDERDLPTPTLVALCEECSTSLIDAHARLYLPIGAHDPFPGVMGLCLDCRHRRGLECRHADRQCNGGTGLRRTIKPPMHLNYGGGKGSTIYTEPATACSGRETV